MTAKKRTTNSLGSNSDRNGSSSFASLLDSMSGETLAGIIFGLLIVLLFIFLCVIFILIRYKENSDSLRAAATDGTFHNENDSERGTLEQSSLPMVLQDMSRCLFGRDIKCSSSLCSCCPCCVPSSNGHLPNELTNLNGQISNYTTTIPYGNNCNGGSHTMNHANGTLGKNSIIVRIDPPPLNGQILGNGIVTSSLITGSPSSMSSGCPNNMIRIV